MTEAIAISPFFVVCINSGIVFVLAGWILLKYPPKRINHWYGYRTPSSQKNQERWDFAQHYSAKEMIRMGVLLALISLFGFLFNGSFIEAFAGILVMLVLVICMFYRVENAISTKFGR